ncbi:lim and transglutaminase domain protein ltd-1-like [Littorina saxatilis]|uniref:Transglutaminase-like domain-containing protein n=1 Tax=Littorina saxatilis TaxID=31220 RepID=A0AAN9GPA1_9CAEN
MGCGASKGEERIEPIDVPDAENGYPPTKPPRDRKEKVFKEADCASIDANVKRAPASLLSNYKALIDFVTQDARNDVQKVRAIYSWLAAQEIMERSYSSKVKDANTPEGYMKTIKQGDGSYTAFFALLCRAARIPCVIIRGSGKAASYEVGDQEMSEVNSAWTAVHVDGSWRLVHVFWALVGLAGFNKGGWTKVEEGGQAVRQKEKASEGKTVNRQEDFWFLTDPDQFIYFCRAQRAEWQLLKSPWSMDKYLNVPYFSFNYFDSGFKLTSQHAAILHSEKGKCDISFQHSENVDADLDYTLLMDEKNSKEQLPKSLQLDRYVIQHGTQNDKSLRVRFPVQGIFKVKVSGSANYRTHLASFRLVCDDVLKDVQPYPDNPKIGFGYNKMAEDMGLTKPSQVKGIMVVRQGEIVKIQFKCRTKLDLQTRLLHQDVSYQDLSSYVTNDRSGDDVTITVTVPEHAQNPEYALQVNARQEGSSGSYDNIVNYLLTHGRDETDGSTTDRSTTDRSHKAKPETDEDELRTELRAATESGDIQRLEEAIENFERARLPDDGDLTKARRKLLSLHEKALKAAIKERDLDALEKAVDAANKSTVSRKLYESETYREAESLRSLLRRLKLYMHKILELRQPTVSEIHSYQRPRPLVHSVMKATYLLLGEKEKQLKQWEYIQALLRRQGRESIIRRIREFDTVHMKPYSMRRANTHLKNCNKDLVRQVSAGAGTFYVWSSNIIAEGKRDQNGNT